MTPHYNILLSLRNEGSKYYNVRQSLGKPLFNPLVIYLLLCE